MSVRNRWSPVLCLAFVLSAATLHVTPASPAPPQFDKSGQERPDTLRGSNTLATLTNGTGDRSLSITVDGYGSFGSSTPAGDAIYDPVGATGPSGTVYESGVYLTHTGRFLTTDTFGGASLPAISFTNVTTTSAQSSFTAGQLQVTLTQTVERTASGSVLRQSYQFFNQGTSPQSFAVVRFVDGDLTFDGSIDDAAAVSPDGRSLAEFDSGDNPSSASTFVGITDSGGTPAGFAVQEYAYADDIAIANGIPTADLNQIANDTNGDRITDIPYDVTLALASSFSVGAGQSATYTTVTRFGDQTLAPRATLNWDAPDQNSPLPLPPPEHLRATPINAAATAAFAPITWRRAEVRGYNVYTSSTSPVTTTPENLFTSVPPSQTSASVPTSSGGSFFVVTATYDDGESPPSNEASADVPAATLTSVKVTNTKVVGKGTGFTQTVQVFLDGIPFVSPAKVKNGKKVTQKGTLVTGQTVGAYLASKGGVVLVQFRNSNGGIAARRYPN